MTDTNGSLETPTHTTQNLRGILPVGQVGLGRLLTFFLSLTLFLVALELMKTGANGLTPLTRDLISLDDALTGLGFGWLTSYIVLSGSPIAAVALALFDAGSIGASTAFTMIVGSRMGASLIVMFVGLIYILRGHEQRTSLLTGLLALIITGIVYIPAVPLGLLLLNITPFRIRIRLPGGTSAGSALDALLGPPVELATTYLPDAAIFGLGLVLTIASLSLIDRALPEFHLEDNVFGGVSRLLYRPAISFILGLAITLLTMSVSVSLSLLVPLSVRGYIRRENLVPYIMGCNISTFVDTLIAGLLLRNAAAADIVVVQILSVTVVSVAILAFFYRSFEQFALRSALWLNRDRLRLQLFLLVTLLIPLTMIVV
ncbi:MAG: hypothetical protein R3191_05680 [Anaerolineales bacterium]|nr:hypothetical protein [Anaerolineales bacterium]